MSTPPDERNLVSADIPDLPLEQAIHSSSFDVLAAAASNPGLNEDLALALLHRPDMPSKILEQFNKNKSALIAKSPKLKLALVQHPKTPRHISLPLVRQLFTFDLMQVALAPVTPADVKKSSEDALLNRMETISLGERISLARRASARVAGELLLASEGRVIEAALENPHLTEASVIKALAHRDVPAILVHTVCGHAKWSLRREVRITLLRNEHTPLAQALEFAEPLPALLLLEILQASSLPEEIKSQLLG